MRNVDILDLRIALAFTLIPTVCFRRRIMNRLCTWSAIVSLLAASVQGQELVPTIHPGHNLLQESELVHGVEPGKMLPSLAFHDVLGSPIYLTEQLERGPCVVVFLSTNCPVAKRYTQRLRRIHEEFAKRGVSVMAVFPNSDETLSGIRQYAQDVEFTFPVVRDVNGYLTKKIGATMTPQAFVIDPRSVLRYRGAIDDNRYENRVKANYLVDALEQVLAGREVAPSVTQALGCSVHLDDAKGDSAAVTYSGHIARILQDNCQSCHREGQVAPFAITNYEEARRWKTEIRAYTQSRLMPPWKAAPHFGEFSNDISLTDEEVELIARWVDQDAPLGAADELPPTPHFHDGWAFNDPDLIIEMPEEYVVGAEGEDDYRHFVIPYEASEDRFVEAIDVRPGNQNVVHHVIAYVDTTGEARKLDALDEGPGYTRFGGVGFKSASTIGGWAPGNLPVRTPLGSGQWLPKKCDIVLQVHYYRTGVEERDRTKVGIYFSKVSDPVATRLGTAINRRFNVKAGDSNAKVSAEYVVEQPSYLFSVTPHMHLIGKTMQVTAHLPDGRVFPLVKIDDWDFNWQTDYHFREMLHLPAGTKVKLIATFDNSSGNTSNPNDPPQDVGWGEKTTDEMCIAFLGLLRESEYDPSTQSRRLRVVRATSPL